MDGDHLLEFDLQEYGSLPPRGAIQVRADETVGGAIRRICIGQLDRALQHLADRRTDRDMAVHTARKAMKRVRGMIRLVRDPVGYRPYRDENVVLRDTSRLLAPVRDGAVMLQVLDRLARAYGVAPDGFEATRRRLSFLHREARAAVLGDPVLMTHAAITLRACRARFAAWPVDRNDHPMGLPDRFESIGPGIRRVYRRGRRAAQRSMTEPTTSVLHEWRKRVKYLRYQMEALEPIRPEVVGGTAGVLDLLGETLGDEHDLAVFEDLLETDAGIPAEHRRLLLVLAHAERIRIQAIARSLGTRIYAEKPAEFTARIGSYWDAWHTGTLDGAGRVGVDGAAR